MLVGIVVAFFVEQFKNLALEAVYVLVAGFILLGFIIILNNTQKKMDSRGIIINEDLFKTRPHLILRRLEFVGYLQLFTFSSGNYLTKVASVILIIKW